MGKVEAARVELAALENKVLEIRRNIAELHAELGKVNTAKQRSGVTPELVRRDADIRQAIEELENSLPVDRAYQATYGQSPLDQQIERARRRLLDVRRERATVAHNVEMREKLKAEWGDSLPAIVATLRDLMDTFNARSWPAGLEERGMRAAIIGLENTKRDIDGLPAWRARLAEYGDDDEPLPNDEPSAIERAFMLAR